MLGLGFMDAAIFDPVDPSVVYTEVARLRLDYDRRPGTPGYEPGCEWGGRYDVTIDHGTYDDARVRGIGQYLPVAAHQFRAQTYVYFTGMKPTRLGIYRTQSDSAILRPVAMLYAGSAKHRRPWPLTQPEGDTWIWIDQDGDGRMQAGEFTGTEKLIVGGNGWFVDDQGTVWNLGGHKAIQRIPLRRIDDRGVPHYRAADITHIEVPAPFYRLGRLVYDASSDTMYLGGFLEKQYAWKHLGDHLVCYADWSSPDRRIQWRKRLVDDDTILLGLAMAGDRLFYGYSRTTAIGVLDRHTGAFQGHLGPGLTQTGWLDMPQPINATQLENGEYLITAEETWKERVMLYRFAP